MAALDAKERSVLHVLAFLFFRMGAMERAKRIYAALVALPPVGGELTEGHDPLDTQAVLGLAAVALECGDSAAALEHVQSLLHYMKKHGPTALAASTRQAVLENAAHLVRAQALRALGRLDEAVEAVRHCRGPLMQNEGAKPHVGTRS